LRDITLQVNRSEVHAFVGEHGAGKSSIAQLISGMLKPCAGKIVFEGHSYNSLSPGIARQLGIEMVYQELQVIENLSVLDCFFLNQRSREASGFIKHRKEESEVKKFIAEHGFYLNPHALMKQLTPAEQLLVKIMIRLYQNPSILILDEVFERLSVMALDKVVGILNCLKKNGMSIILITHRIDDLYNFADKVTILKNGEVLLTESVENIDKLNLIKMAYTQISRKEYVGNLSKEFYQLLKYNEAILHLLPVNLIVTDSEENIKMINKYAVQYFRLENTSCIDQPVEILFFPENDKVVGLLKQAILERCERTFYNIPIAFGSTKTTTNVKTLPIYDGSLFIGSIIIIEDITQQEKLREKFILSEKLASIGLLSAGVAHEINNPLGIVSNYLQSIRIRYHDKGLLEKINALEDQLSLISNIISNLISFSDSNKIVKEELELNQLIQSIIHLLKHNAVSRHIQVSFSSTEKAINLTANKNEIKQVILNLMKNSFEAMPSGGRIVIATERAFQDESSYVKITFRDTGPGITDENPNDVFLPFYSTKKGNDSNLGLGLLVSYGIVKKNHGEITVQNNIEEPGCEFVITFPQ
jgi:two-component system sensor histidine kinase AtoS